MQAEPGKSPDARVAEAQARVSRLQAALDLLGADNPDAELLKASLETAAAMSRAARGRTSGFLLKFVERAQGRNATATLDQVRVLNWPQGCKIWNGAHVRHLQRLTQNLRVETTELRDLRREVEQLRREWNEWLAKPNSQFTEDVGVLGLLGWFDRRI